jgi:hypothetical protein
LINKKVDITINLTVKLQEHTNKEIEDE